MIFSTLSQSERYADLHPLFPRAFEYIRNTDLKALSPSVHQIIEGKLFAIVEQVNSRKKEEAKLECHRLFIDIQLVLDGDETMGWKALAECRDPVDEYSAKRDIRFFNDAPSSWVYTPPGCFCIFFPEDAHAPLVGEGMIRKVIFKIAV
jgi:YhcH/YjgK/YiaL family protein